MKVLIAEKIAEEGISFLKGKGVDVTIGYDLSREDLLDVISQYDGLIVRSVTKVDEALYEKGTQLKVIGRAGNGVDNIQMEGATKRGIIIVNTPDANTVSAAEHTIALMLSMSRHVPLANESIKNKVWDRSPFRGVELKGKTLGIIGLGRIGTMVAKRMAAFEMQVIAYDPYIPAEQFEKAGVKAYQNLDELVAISDFISVHTPKTAETTGIINKSHFAIAKKGLRIVNCARGGIIDEKALYEAIQIGIVAGAAIDVLKDEPHAISPLLDLKETVITPHLGADTVEAQKNVGETVAVEVYEALCGQLVTNAVNLPSLSAHDLKRIRPYLTLAEMLGAFYHQMNKAPVQKVEIIYKGDASELKTDLLLSAFIKGLYRDVLSDGVNYVNARHIASSRGVQILEGKESKLGDYHHAIEATLSTDDGQFKIEGALFGKDEPRVVSLNGYSFDLFPTGPMLLVENIDRPGMIGKIGEILGRAEVNIATMNVSLNRTKRAAMMLLKIDQPITSQAMKELKEADGITRVWPLQF
jgi:D-3-phosphoglycerate dehydrogenase